MKTYPYDPSLRKGTWNVYTTISGITSVMFKDPYGHVGSLNDHQILADGTVKPSVVCPVDGCDFHEWIILENYNAHVRSS